MQQYIPYILLFMVSKSFLKETVTFILKNICSKIQKVQKISTKILSSTAFNNIDNNKNWYQLSKYHLILNTGVMAAKTVNNISQYDFYFCETINIEFKLKILFVYCIFD